LQKELSSFVLLFFHHEIAHFQAGASLPPTLSRPVFVFEMGGRIWSDLSSVDGRIIGAS